MIVVTTLLPRGRVPCPPNADTLVKSVKRLLAERVALTAKERELVRSLNREQLPSFCASRREGRDTRHRDCEQFHKYLM